MFLRVCLLLVILFGTQSARAAQFEVYRGVLHHARGGATLEVFDTREHLSLSGITQETVDRYAGYVATVHGARVIQSGNEGRPILQVDSIRIEVPVVEEPITVRATRISPDGYTPPRTSGERAADAIKVVPFFFF